MNSRSFERAYQSAQEAVSFIPEGRYREVAFDNVFRMELTREEPESMSPSVPKSNSIVRKNGQQVHTKSETKMRIIGMLADGYFDVPQLPSDVLTELKTRGYHHNISDVRMTLLRMAQNRELRRIPEGDRFRYVKV